MKTLTEQLARYAEYHRDARNILTHFIGIPLIVVAVAVLLSRPALEYDGFYFSLATLCSLALVIFYFFLDVGFGLLMALLMALTLWFSAWSATLSTTIWLSIGLGGFVVGWIFQLIGHYFEGRKPAFVDNLIGLLIGPLFIVAEAAFILGWRKSLRSSIEEKVAAHH